ncbi:hypothetical protein CF15_00550 [Pyrodictium occultum]|uniref:ABC transporter n=1 Tax=Pyrodictium occultum TaxID=2309 RepID=A0A0V8RTI9_PYROC|nr:metal ABC transporter permease [Pyrodictium occultum]KSW11390.1 hypothetical protein CF15_00550 [Pyrodictium occultum]
MKGRHRAVLIALVLSIAGFSLYGYWQAVSVYPAVSVLAAGLAFGLMSGLIAARRLFFLAGASPHSALLAAIGAVLLAGDLNARAYVVATPLAVVLIYVAGYMIFRGFDPDVATSVLVSFSASLSVVLVYYAEAVSSGAEITAVVFGDPLLVTPFEAWMTVIVALLVLVLAALSYREQILIGIERDLARISGIPIWLYDLAFFTVMGLVVSVMVRVVGFVLEHVLMLLPGAAAAMSARSARDAILLSVVSSVTAAGLGLALSLLLGISPAGATGLVMLTIYIGLVLLAR